MKFVMELIRSARKMTLFLLDFPLHILHLVHHTLHRGQSIQQSSLQTILHRGLPQSILRLFQRLLPRSIQRMSLLNIRPMHRLNIRLLNLLSTRLHSQLNPQLSSQLHTPLLNQQQQLQQCIASVMNFVMGQQELSHNFVWGLQSPGEHLATRIIMDVMPIGLSVEAQQLLVMTDGNLLEI